MLKMKKIVILVLSFLFLNCEEDTFLEIQDCKMQLSDAQPIQFWPVDCDTYNEKEVCGVFASCFCQPFVCDDEIKIQGYDDSGDSFFLQIVGENGNEISTIGMDESGNVHSASFIPSEYSPDVCDRKVQLKIVRQSTVEDWGFESNSEGWNTVTGFGDPWAWTAAQSGSVLVTFSGSIQSELLRKQFPLNANNNYRIHFYLYINNPNAMNVTAEVQNSGGSRIGNTVDIVASAISTGFYDGYMDIDDSISGNVFYLALDASNESVNGAELYLLRAVLYNRGTGNVTHKSDCIDIKTTHDCTKLISYSNNRVFNGLYFNTSSPDETFYLRIPATFVHERFPEEDEVLKRTSDTITLNSTMEAQKLLETGYMPYYMHRKTKLVLKMQTVTIDNQQWVKQEAYEIQEGNKRHPKKMARVWLNESDFVQRNVL